MSFKKNKYQIIRGAISKEVANIAYRYLQISAEADQWMLNNGMTHVGNKLIGNFNDPQVPNSYAKYGDRLMETLLVKTIDIIKVNLNPNLGIRGVLLTMFDKRNKLSSQVDKEARNYFKEKVYETVIPRNVRLSEAPSHGLPCVIYDKTCLGSKSYLKLADEFLVKKNINVESAA